MITPHPSTGGNARATLPPDRIHLFSLLTPAVAVVIVLFGGGLALGFLQAMGYLPGAGLQVLTLEHLRAVCTDPDFFDSLELTLYIALTSTVIAAACSILLVLALIRAASTQRLMSFLLQIPLTVPHLVIAISTIFLLAPSGLFSRLFVKLSILDSAADFPLLINDQYLIGTLAVYIWKEIPFITIMLLAVLRNSGTELLDVGRTLNATPLQRFCYITLPIMAPALGAACLIVFAFTFGAFEVPYLLGRTYPMALPVWAYKNYSDIDLLARPEGIAIGLIIAAVVTCAILSAQAVLSYARKRGIIL